jgi:hypothetical protein
MTKKRGAPLGNKNARKHGYYAFAFSREELKRLSKVEGEYLDEINLMRLLIGRTAASMREQENMPFQEVLAAQRSITFGVHALNELIRNQKALYANQTSFEQALDELKDLDPFEDE